MTAKEWKESVIIYEKLVFIICYQLIRDYQEAENLTQETFLSAYTHRERCNVETVKPWLARIATNKAKDYLKSAYVRRVKKDFKEEKEEMTLITEDIVIVKEGVENIKKSIYELKEPYQKVCILYFLKEKSVDEIAFLLSRPKKTVETQLYRGKKILQSKMKEGG